jgi:capsid protein
LNNPSCAIFQLVLGVSYEQLSRNYSQMSYSTARASANESWAFFMGRRKFVAARQACQMFLCWLEEAIARRVVILPQKPGSASRKRELPGVMPTGSARAAWLLTG